MSTGTAPTRLLVIEDNPGDRKLIAIKLAEAMTPWAMDSAATLTDGLKLSQTNPYACILVDLGLPDATGIEAVTRMKAAAPGIALVVLTGLDDERVAQEAIRAGAQDYLVKSLTGLDMLGRVINHAIERQQTQTAMELSRHTLQALLDASHDVALLLDDQGLIITANAQAAEFFSTPVELLKGQDAFSLWPEALSPHRRACFEQALETGRTVQYEDNDGFSWYTHRVLAVGEAQSRRCAMFSRDISAERVAAKSLAKARDEAEMANRSKTEFMGRMSRDIRTPLNDVIGFAEMISAQMLGPIQPVGYADYADNILKSGSQILKMIDRITDVSMLESALLKDQASYRDLVELSPDLICVCVDGVIERINAAGLGMLRASSMTMCEGKPFLDFIHPDYRSLFDGGLETLYEEDHPIPVKVVTFAGRNRDVELNAVPLRRDGHVASLVVGRDTTEVTAAMRAVAAREHRIRAIMDTVLDGIITIDEDGIIGSANLSVERIFGYSLTELIGAHVSILIPDASQDNAGDPVLTRLAGGAVIGAGCEVTAQRKDGALFPVHLSVSELRLDKRRLFTGTIRDLTENKELAQRVAYLANHDPLTDLPNRSLLTDQLAKALENARVSGLHVAVLTIDLAGFTMINDSLGHDVGNDLLRETARRLSQTSALVGGVAARLAGDEFAVVLPGLKDLAAVTIAVEQVRETLFRPIMTDGSELSLPADIGVSVFPRDGHEPLDLLRNAEMALHQVKKRPDESLGFFDTAMSYAVSERMTLERSMKDALKHGQFELFYQPQVRLPDYQLIGAEALVRWRHAELGVIAPDKFIPVAEETGLIVPIGEWVLRRACDQMREWQDEGMAPLRIGVNISGRQFREVDLANVVASAIQNANINPHFLDLELTESMLMADGEATLRVLRALADLGVHLSIDDFGTGYSSLAYLKRFPVNTVKIDRAFVRDLDHDEDGRAIANAIISLAHSLSMNTIAEGVETEMQATLLASHGCDEIQGYMIGRPMPAADFRTFVKEYKATARHGRSPCRPEGVGV